MTENNLKYIKNIIRKLKNIYRKNKNVNIYAFAYQSMSSSAQDNQEIKQLYINGWPLCFKDSSLPMKPDGWCRGKNRSPRFKFICPKTNHKSGKRNCYCEDPCTDSSYGRVTYTYPDQNLRTYPGIIKDTDDWIDLYKKSGVVEQTINYFKDAMVTGNLKTQNLKNIKADVFLAGITQLLTLILADKMDKPENIRSLRLLIA